MREGRRYDKDEIEREAVKSAAQGRITEPIGRFIIDMCEEVSLMFATNIRSQELIQSLRDAASMRVLENFLRYYDPERKGNSCAANLILSMIHTSMKRRMAQTTWTDVYGELNKEFVPTIDKDGKRSVKLLQSQKDETISRVLSGERVTDFI